MSVLKTVITATSMQCVGTLMEGTGVSAKLASLEVDSSVEV